MINYEKIYSPSNLRLRLPTSEFSSSVVDASRSSLTNILQGKDKRIFLVVGPCSMHDPIAGLDYAKRLKNLSDEVNQNIFIIMRVYFEKPRTITGWKGYINDPLLDESFRIDLGLEKSREFLLSLCEMGLPIGTEALSPLTYKYYEDLITWAAIGARTTESQIHREMASAISSPIGFKNSTNGDVKTAINAILFASKPHSYLGLNSEGFISVERTDGNKFGHLILRGSDMAPNYYKENVDLCEKAMVNANLKPSIVVDCSHGNSQKDPVKQISVMTDVIQQVLNGRKSIVGLMLESNIEFGNQEIASDLTKMKYGCSITDKCLDWTRTESLIREANTILSSNL